MHPPIIHDPLFGELKFDPTDYLRWYEGAAPFTPDHTVGVFVYTEGGEPFSILERARSVFATLQRRASEYPLLAAKDLLAVYNENWNDGEPIDTDRFVGRMELFQVYFHPDGRVDLDYYDNDLFLGHSIAVRLDEHLNVAEVGLEG
jgi:hypothetical protein